MTATLAREATPDADRRAQFHEIFDREFDYVWASLRRLGVHDRDTEDVAQEVFVQVHKKIDDYDPARPIRPWLFAFAFRCASDWRRLARHRVEVFGEHPEPPTSKPDAVDLIGQAEDVDLVMRALEQVEMDQRAVFVLFELDECPMKEIAAELAIPLFTAYSRLRLAREKFTEAIRRLGPSKGAS
jgi:RNA polymerase sigma-70 factor, ECF subfamily